MTTKQEANEALTELRCVSQTIGNVGLALKRCRPGSKRFTELVISLTELESKAARLESTVRLALYRLPDND